MKRLLKEPLLHFLLLGAVIFAAYTFVSKHTSSEPGKIVVTQGQLASMWQGFATTRQRSPTREEWEGLIRARVREEVYYREALALGLDKDDTVIRRRLQQKMEFVSDDIAVQTQPSDSELNAYLQAHPDQFRLEPRFAFRQVFLEPRKRGNNLSGDIARLLAQLNRAGGTADTSTLGDPIMLDRQYKAIPAGDVARLFGDKFATALGGLSLGHWHGPVESSFGVHLVFISERSEVRTPTLTEARDAVLRQWGDARRLDAKEQSYREMLRRYTVTVENPEPVPTTVASVREK